MDRVEKLIQELRDPDAEVREDAAEALGRLRDAKAVPALLDALDDESRIAHKAILALGDIGDKSAVDRLIEELDCIDPGYRHLITEVLGKLKDDRAVLPLIALLEDYYSETRESAAWALGRIGDVRAVPGLISLLKDKDVEVRGTALEHLIKSFPAELTKVSESLQEYARTVKKSGSPEDMEEAKAWITEAYIKIAKAVSERKKADMPGEMLEGKIKPPKKPGIYRTRRVANG